MQADVARRIALMDSTSPEIINEVEQILEQKLSATVTQDYTQTGGVEAVVDVLNGVDRATERTILMHLKFKIRNWLKKLRSECLSLKTLLHLIIERFNELFVS